MAFKRTQGDVGLTQSCNPTEMNRGATTSCSVEAVNNSFESQTVALTSTLPSMFSLTQVTGATQTGPRRVTANTTLTPAALGVPSVDPGGFGFLPLASFGITPTPSGTRKSSTSTSPRSSTPARRGTGSESTPTAT